MIPPITKEYTLVESIVFQLRVITDFKVNNTDLIYLAYIHLYPDTYAEQLLKDEISKSKESIKQKLHNLTSLSFSNGNSKLYALMDIPNSTKKRITPSISKFLSTVNHQVIINIKINE